MFMIDAFQSISGLFLKVGKSKYIMDMYANEYLFFSPLAAFRAKERDPSGRNDPREGNLTNHQAKDLEITVPNGPKIKLQEVSSQFTAQFIESPTVLRYNVCSLYLLRLDGHLQFPPIDDRMLSMGDMTLVIHNATSFLEVLDESLSSETFDFSRKPVKYYDPKTFNGSLGVHDKDNCLEYQSEYRIILDTPGTAGIKVKLPGLKEMSTLRSTDVINKIKLFAA